MTLHPFSFSVLSHQISVPCRGSHWHLFSYTLSYTWSVSPWGEWDQNRHLPCSLSCSAFASGCHAFHLLPSCQNNCVKVELKTKHHPYRNNKAPAGWTKGTIWEWLQSVPVIFVHDNYSHEAPLLIAFRAERDIWRKCARNVPTKMVKLEQVSHAVLKETVTLSAALVVVVFCFFFFSRRLLTQIQYAAKYLITNHQSLLTTGRAARLKTSLLQQLVLCAVKKHRLLNNMFHALQECHLDEKVVFNYPQPCLKPQCLLYP